VEESTTRAGGRWVGGGGRWSWPSDAGACVESDVGACGRQASELVEEADQRPVEELGGWWLGAGERGEMRAAETADGQ
jgi:hypothetical protein